MKDLMISFSFKDEPDATWINDVLKEAGYSTIFAGTDFKVGNDFLHEMDKAVETADRLIVVYSEHYDTSNWAPAELRSFLHDDPNGELGKIIPILISDAKPKGLIKSRIYVDIADELNTNRELAEQKILQALKNEPTPSSSTSQQASSTAYMPKINRQWSDEEKERFITDTFQSIYTYFERALEQVKSHHPHFSYELVKSNDKAFTVKLLVYDQVVDTFQIWLNDSFGYASDVIAYYQSPHHHTYHDYSSMNGWLSLEDDGQILFWTTSFNAFSDIEVADKLSIETAADYLWRLCVKSLENVSP